MATTAMPDATPVVVSGGRDGTVRMWRLADGTPVGMVVNCGYEGTVRVWYTRVGRLADGAPAETGHGEVDAVAAGALPDGTPVIIGGANEWLFAWPLADGAPVWKSMHRETLSTQKTSPGTVQAQKISRPPNGRQTTARSTSRAR